MRLMLEERNRPPSPAPPGTRKTKSTPDRAFNVAASVVLAAAVVYLVSSALRKCYLRLRRRGAAEASPSTAARRCDDDDAARDAEPGTESLSDIPVLVVRSTGAPMSPYECECCPVCLGRFEVGEEYRQLPRCKHVFHRECIDRWLPNHSASCPVCRDRMAEEEPTVESRVQPGVLMLGGLFAPINLL
ncbi:hypothetical protein H6P81_018457 [Aristolochia fimbriata]|uniref:RING-type E3 ubiquitin transferase n=1 Tax=Aristolochia fimbriata TaxID=158543 RepID=A0AAV7E202_ARIFI|nr:hypothetical protein H6P81_018457 [Aristolochia fimbriata]